MCVNETEHKQKMYQTHQQCSDIFKPGLVSSDMFSFSQTTGVTSSALVDFSCRCTWCFQDGSVQAAIPKLTSNSQFQNSDARTYGRMDYPRPSVAPKTFSPILVYQRPSYYDTPDCHFLEIAQRRNVEDSGAFQKVIPRKAMVDSNTEYSQNSSASRQHIEMTGPTFTFPMKNVVHPKKNAARRISSEQHINQIFSDFYESDKLLHSNSDSANMRFFIDTKYGCLDNFGIFSGNNDDVMTPDSYATGHIQGSLEHLYDSYLDLFNEIPVLPMETREPEEKKNRKYKCPRCNVCCANNGQLKGHMRVHTGEKPFVCDFKLCKRSFARNEELTRHKRIHLGLRPHQCAMCTKSFGRKDHLNKHEKTHLKTADKKVHLCAMNGCQQSYTRSDALARHQWSAHAIKAKSTKWRTNVHKS